MHLNGQDATPWTRKLLIFKCITGSQAGRRGFEPRLPLHLFNDLHFPVSPCAPFVLRLDDWQQTALHLIHSGLSDFHWRLRVHILVYVQAVPKLIGHQLAIYSQRLHDRGMGSAHHLKARPPQPDLGQPGLNVPPPAIVARQRCHSLRGENPGVVPGVNGELPPRLDLA